MARIDECFFCFSEPEDPVSFSLCACIRVYCRECLQTHLKLYHSSCPVCHAKFRLTKATSKTVLGDPAAMLLKVAALKTSAEEDAQVLQRAKQGDQAEVGEVGAYHRETERRAEEMRRVARASEDDEEQSLATAARIQRELEAEDASAEVVAARQRQAEEDALAVQQLLAREAAEEAAARAERIKREAADAETARKLQEELRLGSPSSSNFGSNSSGIGIGSSSTSSSKGQSWSKGSSNGNGNGSSNGSSNGPRGPGIIDLLSAPTSGAAAANKTSASAEDKATSLDGFTCHVCTYEHRGLEAHLLSCTMCDTVRLSHTKSTPDTPKSHVAAASPSRKRGGGGGGSPDDNESQHGETSDAHRKKARISESGAGPLSDSNKSTVCIDVDELAPTDTQGVEEQAASTSASSSSLEASPSRAASMDSLRRQCPVPLLVERVRVLLRGRGCFGVSCAAPFFGQDDEWSCGYQNTRTLLASLLVLRAEEEAAALLLPCTSPSPDSPSPSSSMPSAASAATAAASAAAASSCLPLLDPSQFSPPPACVPAGWLEKCQGAVPSVLTLQEWIEAAWAEGFDPCGKKQLHNRLARTRKWIGATEVFALLSSLGLKCKLVDFEHGPDALIAWLADYFLDDDDGGDDEEGDLGSSNGSRQVPGSWAAAWRRGALGAKPPPVYLQYNTHSITVVGALRESAGGKTSLLVLCPMKASAPGALGSDKWQKTTVWNASHFQGRQFQLVHVLPSAKDLSATQRLSAMNPNNHVIKAPRLPL